MVHIKDFKVYPWDTHQTITERLAAHMNTLPKYLYFYENQDWDSFMLKKDTGEEQVGDLLQDMKDAKSVGYLSTLIAKIRKTPPKFLNNTNKLDIMVDIIKPFIAYNTTLESAGQVDRRNLFLLIQTIIKDPFIPASMLWDDRDRIKERITKSIDANKVNVDDNQLLIKTKGLPHTKFIRQEVSIFLEFDFKGITLLEVFDKIKLTPRVPFASVNNLYKILRDFTPDPNWGSLEKIVYSSNFVQLLLQMHRCFLTRYLW